METNGYGLIKNARLVDTEKKEIESCDILFSRRTKNQESLVMGVGSALSVPEDRPVKLYSARSRLFCRAFVDTACYIASRGDRNAETYATAAQAAQAGGFSAVALMPTLEKPFDTPTALASLQRECSSLDVQFLPIASLAGYDRAGYRIGDYKELKKAGAVALAPIEKRYFPPDVLLEAMCQAKEADMTVFCSVAGSRFAQKGAVNAGRIADLLHLKGIPACAELLSVNESLLLAEESGCRIHIPVISLGESVEAVRRAKQRGVQVTCGTSAPYFSLTEDDLIFRGVNAKLDPPLRAVEDRRAIIQGLCDGTIDCITADHRPCTREEKGNSIATGAFGAAGLETTFAAGFTYLVLSGQMDLFGLLQKLIDGPARVLGIASKVQQGNRTDLVMLDEDEEMIYTNHTLRSRARNTPYFGTALRGLVAERFINGK